MKALPELITVESAAERLTIRPGDVIELVTDGTLSSYRMGGQIRILADDVTEYLRAIGANSGKSEPTAPPEITPLINVKFPELADWLKSRYGIIGQVKVAGERVGKADIIGRVVYGNLPEYLAILASKYFKIEIPNQGTLNAHPTADELDAARAHIVHYRIEAVQIIEPTYPGGKRPTNGNGKH